MMLSNRICITHLNYVRTTKKMVSNHLFLLHHQQQQLCHSFQQHNHHIHPPFSTHKSRLWAAQPPQPLPSLSSGSMNAETESLSRTLWSSSRKLAFLALYNPFVVALAAGTLKLESFRHYIAQDAVFLQTFSQAYGLALENTDDEDAKSSISQLQSSVDEELRLHISYAQALGVDLSKENRPNSATIRYTDFLLTTATGGMGASYKALGSGLLMEEKKRLSAFTIGAMTPCMRLYAFLGRQISKILGPKDRDFLYGEWVETYSSEGFEASAFQTEQLLDRLAMPLHEEDVKKLESLYQKALNFEVDFFSAQPFCHCTHVPYFKRKDDSDISFLLVSDFDLTCSVTDSCHALAEVSINTAIRTEKHDGPSKCSTPSELRRKWDMLEKSYIEERTNLLAEILPQEEGGFGRGYNSDGLRDLLKKVSQFEHDANSKVIQAGVLQGLGIQDLEEAGRQMALQEGCADFLLHMLDYQKVSNVEMHIMSVCWSRAFIASAFASGGIQFGNVHSNELDFNGCLSSGDIVRQIETPFDKVREFEQIQLSLEKKCGKQVQTVYIGDSVTDLLCLLKADVGIVVGSSLTLRRVADAFGVTLVPIYAGLLEQERASSKSQSGWTGRGGVLYSVTNWYEIHAFLIGSHINSP